jgi:hypothetical protein
MLTIIETGTFQRYAAAAFLNRLREEVERG